MMVRCAVVVRTSLVGKAVFSLRRHAELVSASYFESRNIKTLKQVQGDDAGLVG